MAVVIGAHRCDKCGTVYMPTAITTNAGEVWVYSKLDARSFDLCALCVISGLQVAISKEFKGGSK